MNTKQCAYCETSDTPLWRKGPTGSKTLCNACGLMYKKKGSPFQKLITEKAARRSAERSRASITQDLEESSSANEKTKSPNDVCQSLQDYNASLQQYNIKLQTELTQTRETLWKVEREKASLLSNLQGYRDAKQDELQVICNLQSETIRRLQEELATAQKKTEISDLSAAETRKRNEELKKVNSLLQIRLGEAESLLVEGEAFLRSMCNMILELCTWINLRLDQVLGS